MWACALSTAVVSFLVALFVSALPVYLFTTPMFDLDLEAVRCVPCQRRMRLGHAFCACVVSLPERHCPRCWRAGCGSSADPRLQAYRGEGSAPPVCQGSQPPVRRRIAPVARCCTRTHAYVAARVCLYSARRAPTSKKGGKTEEVNEGASITSQAVNWSLFYNNFVFLAVFVMVALNIIPAAVPADITFVVSVVGSAAMVRFLFA